MPDNQSPNLGNAVGESLKQPVAKTADDINDLFKELDEPAAKKVKDPIADDDSDEDDAEGDDNLDLVEPDEDIEKLDLNKADDDLDITAPPRKKEIQKKYPEIFKDFPFLEKMLYRDKEYTALFGSFDDAKDAAEQAETFKGFESQLLSGNTEEILKGIKETDEKAFNIIVDDYLTTLHKVDKDAYLHVVGNLNKRLIMEMVQEATESGNDDLKAAAMLVNQFVFGSAKFTAPANRVDRTVDEKTSEAETERLRFVQERFETSRDDLQGRVDNTLRATISEYIDPKGTMSAYVKKNAVNDALSNLSSAIASDPSVPKMLDKLWRAAFDAKFSKDSLSKIQRFYLGNAKKNLRGAIMKARTEALKDATPRSSRKEEDDSEPEEKTPQKRGLVNPGRTSQPKKNEMKRGESVADFFARD